MIEGSGLDRVTSVQLGEIDIHVPPAAATEGTLRLSVIIPHGQAPGPLSLTLSSGGGSARAPGIVTVTPIVISPSGAATGRGTFTSPLRLCGVLPATRYGDILLLRNGVHECSGSVGLPRGVTVRGESKVGAIDRGFGGANDGFRGFSVVDIGVGAAVIENLPGPISCSRPSR